MFSIKQCELAVIFWIFKSTVDFYTAKAMTKKASKSELSKTIQLLNFFEYSEPINCMTYLNMKRNQFSEIYFIFFQLKTVGSSA